MAPTAPPPVTTPIITSPTTPSSHWTTSSCGSSPTSCGPWGAAGSKATSCHCKIGLKWEGSDKPDENRPHMRRHPGLPHPGFTKPEQPRPTPSRRERLRILVVDRDDDRRDLTCVSVSVLGHRAEEAWDTRGALVALATEAFDVVILDDQMPGFDVLEV